MTISKLVYSSVGNYTDFDGLYEWLCECLSDFPKFGYKHIINLAIKHHQPLLKSPAKYDTIKHGKHRKNRLQKTSIGGLVRGTKTVIRMWKFNKKAEGIMSATDFSQETMYVTIPDR